MRIFIGEMGIKGVMGRLGSQLIRLVALESHQN